MRLGIGLVILGLAMGSGLAAPKKSEPISSATFFINRFIRSSALERARGAGLGQLYVQMPTRILWKKGKVRAENVGGVLICDGKNVYIYRPNEKSAERISARNVSLWKSYGIPDDLSRIGTYVQKGKKLGACKLREYACEIYELREKRTGRPVTIALTSDLPGFPLPIQVESPGNTPDRTIVTRVERLQLNPALPDSFFILPRGTKITDVSSIQPAGLVKGIMP